MIKCDGGPYNKCCHMAFMCQWKSLNVSKVLNHKKNKVYAA